MNKRILSVIVIAFAAVLLCVLKAQSGMANHADPLIRSKLYQTSRARLALARARGAHTFSVMLASVPGKNAEVVDAIKALGGTIDWRADEVDFLEATLPIDNIETLARSRDIASIDADTSIKVLGPTPATPTDISSTTAFQRTAADETPLLHPYLPGHDIGTLALRAEHSTYDGRGVTVAVIDGTPDFLLPELRYGETLDGKRVPKFVDIRTVQDSRNNKYPEYSSWLPTQPVQARSGIFTVDGTSYRAPYDGAFRFVSLRSAEKYGPVLDWGAIYPGIVPEKNTVLFNVLWDEQSGVVWVDSNNSYDFSKVYGLRDYHVRYDYGIVHFQPQDPEARKTIGYVVQTDVSTHKLTLLFGINDHSSGAMGSIGANPESGGLVEGIAPGARLYSIFLGGSWTASTAIEAVITAARNPQVDAIDLEIVSALSYAPKDGNFTQSVIFDRVVRTWGKPIIQPADNAFGMGKLSEPCVPEMVLCVGAYQSRDSYLVDNGIELPRRDYLHFISAFGPAGNGRLKPDILAPSGWVSLGSIMAPENAIIKGLYNLPPGYQRFGGTSQAAPTAAGAVAVLLSAARQQGLHITPQNLVAALTYTARYLKYIPAYEQGSGLLQVDTAFRWLQQHAHQAPVHVTFDAPVHTQTSWMLPTPDRGVGLFEREGWTVGEHDIRTLRVTRDTGSSSPEVAHAELVGNDGTFTTSAQIVLPRGRPVGLQVGIIPKNAGAHSALLRLRSQTGVLIAQTLLTIVAGDKFTTHNRFTITHHVNVLFPEPATLFLTIPKGTEALMIRLALPSGQEKNIEYRLWLPDSNDPRNISNAFETELELQAGTNQEVFPHPQPGTWEMSLSTGKYVYSFETRHVHPIPVTITAAITSTQGGRLPLQRVAKQFATVATAVNTVAAGQERVYTLHVPHGAIGIGAQLKSARGSYLYMYLLDCTKPVPFMGTTKPVCKIVNKGTETSAIQSLYSDHPASGLWKLVVDGYYANPSGTSYRLQSYTLRNQPITGSVLARTFSALGKDPFILDNDLAGFVDPSKGLHPHVFDVQLLPQQ